MHEPNVVGCVDAHDVALFEATPGQASTKNAHLAMEVTVPVLTRAPKVEDVSIQHTYTYKATTGTTQHNKLLRDKPPKTTPQQQSRVV